MMNLWSLLLGLKSFNRHQIYEIFQVISFIQNRLWNIRSQAREREQWWIFIHSYLCKNWISFLVWMSVIHFLSCLSGFLSAQLWKKDMYKWHGNLYYLAHWKETLGIAYILKTNFLFSHGKDNFFRSYYTVWPFCVSQVFNYILNLSRSLKKNDWDRNVLQAKK